MLDGAPTASNRRLRGIGKKYLFRFLGMDFAGVSQWFLKLISSHSCLRFLNWERFHSLVLGFSCSATLLSRF